MIKRLDELESKCKELGLVVVQKGKRPAKDDYVKVLREHFMKKDGLPYTELEPMLCFAEWNLKESEQQTIWASKRWIAQKKLNGCRAILHFIPGKGVYAHSRTVSVQTFRYSELTDQLLFADFKHAPCEMVIDCEVLVEKPIDTRGFTAKGQKTQTSLHSTTALLSLESEQSKKIQIEQDAPLTFQAFDIVKRDGQDLRKQPLRVRLAHLALFENWIKTTEIGKYFGFPAVEFDSKRAYFQKIVAEGGEGVILKNLESPYLDNGSRRRDAWVKVKKRVEFDAYVTGFTRGEKGTGYENLVGSLEFSVMTDKGEHMLGCPINMTLEFRKSISIYDEATDTVKLAPEVYGRVAEISGQDVTARVLRLSHCTLDRWRDQAGDTKLKEECVVKMADLKAASEWVG